MAIKSIRERQFPLVRPAKGGLFRYFLASVPVAYVLNSGNTDSVTSGVTSPVTSGVTCNPVKNTLYPRYHHRQNQDTSLSSDPVWWLGSTGTCAKKAGLKRTLVLGASNSTSFSCVWYSQVALTGNWVQNLVPEEYVDSGEAVSRVRLRPVPVQTPPGCTLIIVVKPCFINHSLGIPYNGSLLGESHHLFHWHHIIFIASTIYCPYISHI